MTDPTSPARRRLHELTYPEVEAIDRANAVVILPVGATEAHGPHLPLGTDVIIATGMADAGVAALAARGREAVVLPAFSYTPAGFARDFAGTIDGDSVHLRGQIVSVARELVRQGWGTLVLANAHLDPHHLHSLHGAEEDLGIEVPELRVVFPDVTRKPWALRLTDEFKSGACHAGRYEGSIVMALRPDLVRDEIARELPANPSSLSVAIRDGLSTFAEAGGDRAYFGYPAEATAEEGRATLAILGEIVADAVEGAPSDRGDDA